MEPIPGLDLTVYGAAAGVIIVLIAWLRLLHSMYQEQVTQVKQLTQEQLTFRDHQAAILTSLLKERAVLDEKELQALSSMEATVKELVTCVHDLKQATPKQS